MIFDLNVLIDTGSPTTYLCAPTDVFEQLEEDERSTDVRGMSGREKLLEFNIYIGEEEAGEIKQILTGGEFQPFLRRQFPSCDCAGILGMDM